MQISAAELEQKAPIFNIQSYCIHDGPGIRVTVFLKGCPLRCVWCANPESHLAVPQLMEYRNKCVGCGRCVSACPCSAITLSAEECPYVITDRSKCVNCGACVAVCEAGAREILGETMTVERVLRRVLKDELFLKASDGGMTISGGEVLVHPDFSSALLKACKAHGLHTAVESCAYASRETVRQVVEHADLCLVDIKQMDEEKHIAYTGVSNKRILENIRFIFSELRKDIIIRVPIITGYNDSEDDIAAVADFVSRELSIDVPMHLLPYHRLGVSKGESLGKDMDLCIEIPTDEHLERLKSIVESFGLTCQIGG